MNWLLLFVPIAIGLELLAPDRHLLVFVTSSLSSPLLERERLLSGYWILDVVRRRANPV
jgi:hypothetical protein